MSSDRKKKKDELTELNQLKERDKINVIGVVYTADDPFQTRGNWALKIQIVDSSCPYSFTCALYGEASGVKCAVGNIIRIRRVQVVVVHGVFQLQAIPGTSVTVFGNSLHFIPCSRSHPKAGDVMALSEKDHISKLRAWSQGSQFVGCHFLRPPSTGKPDPTNKGDPYTYSSKANGFTNGQVTLSCIKDNTYFNLSLMVIGRCKEDSGKTILRCVDGTLPPLDTYKVNSLMVASVLNQVEMARLYPHYVDITVYDEHQQSAAEAVMWSHVDFTNLHCYVPRKLVPSEEGLPVRPEICLHKGCSFKRKMNVRSTPNPELMTQLSILHLDTSPSLFQLPVPNYSRNDISPTRHNETRMKFTDSTKITTDSRTLYRIMVFVDSYSPDNLPSFRRMICTRCSQFIPLIDPVALTSEKCGKCGEGCSLKSELLFDLSVRQGNKENPQTVVCCGDAARLLLRVDPSETQGRVPIRDLFRVNMMVGRWCDMLVVRTEGRLMVVRTSLPPDEDEGDMMVT